MASSGKRTVILGVFSISIIIVSYLAYARLSNADLGKLAESFTLSSILLSMVLLLVSETVKAYRLYYISNILGEPVSFSSTLITRFVGNTAGLLTPGNLGAEPVRVLTLASLNGVKIEKLAAAGVLESFYDIVVAVAISLAASMVLLPASLPVLIVSVVIMALWIAGLTGLVYREGFWKKVAKGISERLPEKYRGQVLSRYKDFTLAVTTGLNPRANVVCFSLTIASFFLIALSFIPLAGIIENGGGAGVFYEVVDFVSGYSMSFVMSFLPTPGGSGFFEYGLGVAMEKELALAWRMVFIIFSLTPTALILLFGVRIRKTVIGNLKKSLGGESNQPSYVPSEY